MLLNKIGILILFIIFTTNINGQLNITGEFRSRGEVNNGFRYLPDSTSETQYYISQRTRLNFDFKKENLQFYVSMQDVRAWGDEDLSTQALIIGSSYGLDLFEGWLLLALNEKVNLKLGRQTFDLDDRRIMSDRNWIQFGQAYDGATIDYNHKGFYVLAHGSYNSTRSKIIGEVVNRNNGYFDGSGNRMKTFNFLYIKKTFNPEFYTSLSAYLSGFQSVKSVTTLYGMGTFGWHLNYKYKNFQLITNVFSQTGKNFEGKSISRAYMLTGLAKYKMKKVWVALGYDRYSGYDATDTTSSYKNEIHTFNLMYGARFIYNGNMNQFVLMDKHTNNGGLNDLYLDLGYQLSKKSNLTLSYHMFSSAEKVYKNMDGNSRVYYESSLGSEIDFTYKHAINKELSIQAGFAYFFATETLEAFKGVVPGSKASPFFTYLMLTYKPDLFAQGK